MKVKSLRTKLLVLLVPFFILSFVVLSGISYYLSNHSLANSTGETARALGVDYSNQVKADIREKIVRLEEVACQLQVSGDSDEQQIQDALVATKKRLKDFDNLVLIFADGTGLRADGSRANYINDANYKKVMITQKANVSDPMVSKVTGKMVVILAVPIIRDGQLKGVLNAVYSLGRLSETIQALKFKENGFGYLAERSGKIIAHPNQELINNFNLTEKKNPELKTQNLEQDDRLITLFKAVVEKGGQLQGMYNVHEGTRFAVLTPVDLPGDVRWVMIIEAPEAEVNKEAVMLSRTMVGISLAFIIIAIVFLTVLSKRFVKPILLIRDECELLVDGDLREQTAKVDSEDEIGQLAQGFRRMRAALRDLVKHVQIQAEQVAASSEELTASSEQSAEAANQVAGSITEIALGSDKQAAAVNQISTVAEKMAGNIEQVSVVAQGVAEIAQNTSCEADAGRRTVEQAVSKMQEIGQGSEAVQAAIGELMTGSREINEIVNLISSIAGQTNLLALNAAIEAARAGEHGRGFAVVAEEVRKLAEESNQAAKQIGGLIHKNQTNMEQVVAVTQTGAEGVRTGIAVVASAGDMFEKIVCSIQGLSEQIKEISEAINHMTSGSRALVTSINEIDTISKTNAAEAQTVSAATEEQSASMQEIASSSQSLATLASDLQAAVAKFKV
ncbi:MAG: methyl-accepting chemotaxis sensory transducer with Cache sensor [Firmicutes bacterium]|nr:methyl-accepting chemotaxis sensory transducer with Cache sensor [Bacillota bacterium]